MINYATKEALIREIQKTAKLFINEFDDVPETKRHVRIEAVDKTPHEMIAYQLGWLSLVMGWENKELAGQEVITPSPDLKWNQLGLLNQQFYCQYGDCSLKDLRELFEDKVKTWCTWINGLSDDELFTPGVRRWTVTSANWPMWKWIHINSVAPFKSFRTKIRKWKKYCQQEFGGKNKFLFPT
ncbi:ClbS/DfsB family four-helix bundle protein [Sporolactobacillus shoreicorticis]|uniref:ClbS/DfsB family four-helix bundle protein n=1 Tax=Sporolactobacillus shoreicorticis TaxID=1923877 RepID=A0ABW5S3E4_9BACL|nr:ClbS/DfsB family four-helix bundle protein [Sporolactobacillus shoreicorticis]MCO7124373.1 ClbS/DfsB family four-helix bundle protein [Sporolactobacillus shoreicorticis]